MLMAGEITGCMMLTIVMLYRWANWRTGLVPHVSAQGLGTATGDAYHRQTFKDALVRLEQMGHIARHMTLGSHKSYSVTVNNFRKCVRIKDRDTGETVLKTFTINKVNTVTYEEFLKGARPEAIPERLPEAVPEALPEEIPEGLPRTCNSKQEELARAEHENEQEQAGEEGGEAADAHPPVPSCDSANRNIWDTWSEDVGKIPASQIRRALLYNLKYNERPFWRYKKLSPALIRRKAQELVDDVPFGWEDPVAAAAAASATDGTACFNLEDDEESSAEKSLSTRTTTLELED
jgi:hypothetical protein